MPFGKRPWSRCAPECLPSVLYRSIYSEYISIFSHSDLICRIRIPPPPREFFPASVLQTKLIPSLFCANTRNDYFLVGRVGQTEYVEWFHFFTLQLVTTRRFLGWLKVQSRKMDIVAKHDDQSVIHYP